MKRILLIIAITFLIFQMVVLATDIDVGPEAINRALETDMLNTTINKENPANASGTITSIEIWSYSNLTVSSKIGIFYVVSGNNLTTRDWVTIGPVTGGSKQTITEDLEGNPISLDVQEGDYIGIYHAGNEKIETDVNGYDGYWLGSGDNIPSTDYGYTLYSGRAFSLRGIGTGPTYNFFGYNSS